METPEVAHALEVAARRWPKESKSQLLLLLLRAGSEALEQQDEVRRGRSAIAATSGKYPEAFGDGYLADLRQDWPE
jgi:hypothetical protein